MAVIDDAIQEISFFDEIEETTSTKNSMLSKLLLRVLFR